MQTGEFDVASSRRCLVQLSLVVHELQSHVLPLKDSTSASACGSVTWVVTVLSYQGKEHAAFVSEIPWTENKPSLLERRTQKYLQLHKSEHHAGHNHSRSAASFERKKSPPSPKKPLHKMLRKWQSRSSWPSGEQYHPCCSLFTTSEKRGLGLLNAHGNEMCRKPRIY